MKNTSKWLALLVAALTGAAAMAAPGNGKGPELKPGDKKDVTKPERPDRIPGVGGIPKGVELPAALKESLKKFQELRSAQTAAQQELVKKLKGATAEEKESIKEKISANRDKFMEDTKQLRADIREQIKTLRATLKDNAPVDGGDTAGKGRGRKNG